MLAPRAPAQSAPFQLPHSPVRSNVRSEDLRFGGAEAAPRINNADRYLAELSQANAAAVTSAQRRGRDRHRDHASPYRRPALNIFGRADDSEDADGKDDGKASDGEYRARGRGRGRSADAATAPGSGSGSDGEDDETDDEIGRRQPSRSRQGRRQHAALALSPPREQQPQLHVPAPVQVGSLADEIKRKRAALVERNMERWRKQLLASGQGHLAPSRAAR